MCRNIRRHMPLATVPIILLTAKNDSGIEYQSAQLGIDAFIAKPFDSSLLVARIKQLLETKKKLEQQMRIEHIKQPELKGEISIDERLLFRITTIIEEHIDNSDLSVEMLSRLMGISQKQLYRKLKSHRHVYSGIYSFHSSEKKPPYCSKMETFPWRKLCIW